MRHLFQVNKVALHKLQGLGRGPGHHHSSYKVLQDPAGNFVPVCILFLLLSAEVVLYLAVISFCHASMLSTRHALTC